MSEWSRIDREVSHVPYKLTVVDSGALVRISEERLDVREVTEGPLTLPLTLDEVEWLHGALGELLALRAVARREEAANDAA